MSTSALAPLGQTLDRIWSRLDGWASVRNLTVLAFFVGATVTLLHRPFSRPEVGDPAIYDYIAQSILRGQLPYRDVVDIKGPGAPYLSAAAMLAGKLLGARDVIAVRALNVLLVGLLSSLTFLVAQTYLKSRAAGLIAFLVPLLRYQFLEFMIEGTQPKLPMIVFGLLSLILIARDKPFWSGFCSMLSCLCWQPGLMFTGVAILMFSRYLTSWRDLRAARVVLGAAIPLAVVLTYFYASGALGDLWAWSITYNYSVFGPEAERTIGAAFDHLWIILRRTFERDTILVVVGMIGLLVFLVERMIAKIKHRGAFTSPDLFRDAVVFPPLIYLVFSLINFQGGPDSIPFFPFIGVFAGWAIVRFSRLIAPVERRLRLEPLLAGICVSAMIALVLWRAVSYHPGGQTLQDQYVAMKPLSDLLGPNDRIYVHGSVEILVLLNRPNLNPYVFLDWGADDFAASRKGASFEAMIDQMEAQAPKLVSISRLRKVNHADDFRRWVDEHYEKLNLVGYERIMIRK